MDQRIKTDLSRLDETVYAYKQRHQNGAIRTSARFASPNAEASDWGDTAIQESDEYLKAAHVRNGYNDRRLFVNFLA